MVGVDVASSVVIALDTSAPVLQITGSLIAISPQSFNLNINSNKVISWFLLKIIEGPVVLPVGGSLINPFNIAVEIPTTYLPNGLITLSISVRDLFGNLQTTSVPLQVRRAPIFDIQLVNEPFFPTTILLK